MSECDVVDPAHGSVAAIQLWRGDRLEKVNLSPESSRPVTIATMTWLADGVPASAARRI
jgi:hypothetical protein